MDLLFQRGRATAADVQRQLQDAPSYSAVRALLRILEEKGHLRHEQDGPRYVYVPTSEPDEVSRSALRHLMRTFFGGSRASALAALLDLPDAPLTDGDYQRLTGLLEQARETGAGE